MKYAFFRKKDNEFINLKADQAKYYSESSKEEENTSQLLSLRNFLIDAGLFYYKDLFINHVDPKAIDIRTYLSKCRRIILTNVKIAFCFSGRLAGEQKSLEEIAVYLGATLESPDKAQFLAIDRDDFLVMHDKVRSFQQTNPNAAIIDSLWVTECFFQNKLVSMGRYKFI